MRLSCYSQVLQNVPELDALNSCVAILQAFVQAAEDGRTLSPDWVLMNVPTVIAKGVKTLDAAHEKINKMEAMTE